MYLIHETKDRQNTNVSRTFRNLHYITSCRCRKLHDSV